MEIIHVSWYLHDQEYEISQPRAELYAALVNTHTGIVRKAFQRNHIGKSKFTDSQIVLYWISNLNLQLKPCVQNRVNEIQYITEVSQWKYVKYVKKI